MTIRDDLKTVKDPYSGEDYVVVPPIVPDVAVIHGLKGDRFGGVTVLGARNDRLLATAARKTIAGVEALVPLPSMPVRVSQDALKRSTSSENPPVD